MEEKINIAEILKNKPRGTKLYSRICGAVELKKVIDVRKKKSIVVKELNSNNQHRFWHDGNFFRAGQCVLQPSENMANWSKFSWKKGDVLQNNDHNTQVIFDRFISDTYEMVRCKYWLKVDNGIERFVVETNVFTKDYFKVSEELSQCYINEIENRCGGKLNLETLEIEKQTEFKDGDIVCISGIGYLAYGIVKNIDNSSKKLEYYVLNDMSTLKFEDWLSFEDKHIQFITETQQIILFDALKKYGKAWDDEKKMIVNLKPNVELKPFDKVVVRDTEHSTWCADLFSHIDEDYRYMCVGATWSFCIPYNEETAKLIGTTNNVEG